MKGPIWTSVLLLLTIWTLATADDHCDAKDSACGRGGVVDEAEYAAYKYKHLTNREDFLIKDILDEIDMNKHEDPIKYEAKLTSLLQKYPNSPRLYSALTRTYRILYNRLSDENKSIGKLEYLKKALDATITVMRLPKGVVPEDLLFSVIEFALANSDALREREWSILVMDEIVHGQNKDMYSEEDAKDYSERLVEELFFDQQYEACLKMIDEVINRFESRHLPMKFLRIIITRLFEKKKDNLYYKDDDELVMDLLPDSNEEIAELINYLPLIDKELREQERMEEIDIMYDFAVEIGMFPSKYQRCPTYVRGLTALPVWEIEETGAQKELRRLEDNWEKIREEALLLMEVTPDANFTKGELNLDPEGKWKQLFFYGFGITEFVPWVCERAPVTCSLLKEFKQATDCPLGTIKFSIIEAGAHIAGHVGGLNSKLRAHLPLVVPKMEEGQPKNAARMVVAKEYELTWEEGKIFVFDDSFEHEVWNESNSTRIVLIVDFDHPELTKKQKGELKGMFKFEDLGDADGPRAMAGNMAVGGLK